MEIEENILWADLEKDYDENGNVVGFITTKELLIFTKDGIIPGISDGSLKKNIKPPLLLFQELDRENYIKDKNKIELIMKPVDAIELTKQQCDFLMRIIK